MNQASTSFVSILVFILLLFMVSQALSQQFVWTQGNPTRIPVRFAPLPILYQQGMHQIGQQPVVRHTVPVVRSQVLPTSTSSNALSMMTPLGGKLRLLSTLFGGLRNSGLEATIAGEIIQRLVKTALKDLLIPFTRDVFTPLLS